MQDGLELARVLLGPVSPPEQIKRLLKVQETPYAIDLGSLSFDSLQFFEVFESRIKILLDQFFWPPSQGYPLGKFAPPATISFPSIIPANIPAKPSRSGIGGKRLHSIEGNDVICALQVSVKEKKKVMKYIQILSDINRY
ncbi:MAG: hypothetical protein DWI24_01975 [Planctomycetota bacterium]|nr:MAG: hypothetical protein DWI24_01975 [Planctomycetota bacterium]